MKYVEVLYNIPDIDTTGRVKYGTCITLYRYPYDLATGLAYHLPGPAGQTA